MTVAGQVTSSAGAPVQGASVSISALDVNARTNAEGRYAFIIRAAQVRGQTVAMVARHGRFGSQTVQFQVVGGSVTQDFVLTSGDRPSVEPPVGETPSRRDTASQTVKPSISQSDFTGDIATAMAGRSAALRVTTAATLGGSSPMLYRGSRSLFGNTQPLVVVNGVAVDNQGFNTIAQRFGLGGFDYGSPLQDVSLNDIQSVKLLDPVTAASRYGSRAANGVLEVTTKSGREVTGFHLSITQRFTGQGATRLPEYQNAFGQGVGGQYEFFDGQGGGVNDAVAESWGPRLDAAAIAQHSLTEPRRPDVRHFLPQPDGTRDYFAGGSTYDANVALLGSRGSSNLRAAVNARSASGLTPGASLNRLGFSLNGAARPTAKLLTSANFQLINASARQRPGTGFDEVNPVSGFARMGRQVDLDALRATVTDANGDQINWIYTDRNNPFFATTLNSNDDKRTNVIGSADLLFEFASWVDARLSVGVTDWSETRKVRVASGWLGGFPTSLGRGDFSGGGSDDQKLGGAERLVNLSLHTRRNGVAGFDVSGAVGAETRTSDFDMKASVSDEPAAGPPVVTSVESSMKHDVTSFYANGLAGRGALLLSAGARMEQSSSLPKSYSVVYPAAEASYDLAQTSAAVREGMRLGQAKLLARWWRSGNEVTKRTLASAYFDGIPAAPEADVPGPERTEGIELGTRLVSTLRDHSLDLTVYRERSTDLLVATAVGDGSALLSYTGEIFNSGVEAALRSRVVETRAIRWDVGLSYSRNTSTVDALRPELLQASLSPTTFGAGLAARIGGPAGVIVGSRFLRDASGTMILRNGLPIADAASAMTVLGAVHPDWTASFESKVRFLGAELFVLFDMRMGGRIFSATNMWGSYAGTLESTLIGDRTQPGTDRVLQDSMVVAGVDSVTGAANTTKVSAEQYFHALGGITEPWVYDAGYTKLREARLSYEVPTRFLPGFREQVLRVSLIGRNLLTWAAAPNIDPETALSPASFHGFEMGQHPAVRSIGVQLTIAP